MTTQLLFLSYQAQQYIQTTVAFLTSRVKKPDEDDWGKLSRVLRYLKGTKYMKLTIMVNDLSVVRWWANVSDKTHHDWKGHSGMMISFGGGSSVSKSMNQRINTKSSTESKLVALDDSLPMILWCLYFMYFIEAQVYTVEQSIVF